MMNRITQTNAILGIVSRANINERINRYLSETDTSYWNKNKEYFLMAAYHWVRMAGVFDPVLAEKMYLNFIPSSFILRKIESLNNPTWDCFFVNLMGVKRFYTLKNTLKHLFPRTIWAHLRKWMKG
ncbi:MAG: hypothetical protein R2795_16275 [Saprospiraceae bacterium]